MCVNRIRPSNVDLFPYILNPKYILSESQPTCLVDDMLQLLAETHAAESRAIDGFGALDLRKAVDYYYHQNAY